jgi:hypothetical protein
MAFQSVRPYILTSSLTSKWLMPVFLILLAVIPLVPTYAQADPDQSYIHIDYTCGSDGAIDILLSNPHPSLPAAQGYTIGQGDSAETAAYLGADYLLNPGETASLRLDTPYWSFTGQELDMLFSMTKGNWPCYFQPELIPTVPPAPPPPSLYMYQTCHNDLWQTDYSIGNDGSAMLFPGAYILSGADIETTTTPLQLATGQTHTFTVNTLQPVHLDFYDGYGNYLGSIDTSGCVQVEPETDPVIVVDYTCHTNGSATFTLRNNGGAMKDSDSFALSTGVTRDHLVQQTMPYQLGAGESISYVASGDYWTFYAAIGDGLMFISTDHCAVPASRA